MTSPAAPLRVLTGITTTGIPHLGNYVGAIRPSVAASRSPSVQSYYFLADLHALIKCPDPDRIQESTLAIASSWLAAGLDPDRVHFYRQSDLPEVSELMWLLTCVTGKGLLNRAHAYKAQKDVNLAAGVDPDHDVTAGLFMYPVLMAADILIFNAHKVPVGRDQVQHLEIARDIAQRFNHQYGELFTLPEVSIEEDVATLPGLDGRKMSKSYDNTIPLFSSRQQLQKAIASILTDSRLPGEPKETEGSPIFQIYQAFATPEETATFRQAFADGIAWSDAKAALFERIDLEIGPMRERYEALVGNPAEVEAILKAGGERARDIAAPFVAKVKQAVGLRRLVATGGGRTGAAAGGSRGDSRGESRGGKAGGGEALPVFKQYRESDGLFRFKLVDAHGATLVQSRGYEAARDAGRAVAALKAGGIDALAGLADQIEPLDEAGRQRLAEGLAQLLS